MDLTSITEFPDRIHPMLVRELRARLRDPRLLLAMIVAHGLLAIGALTALLVQQPAVFIGFLAPVSLLLLLTITYSCGGSLRGEVLRGNFQLLQLVGIDAAKLVRGKWVASFSLVVLAGLSLLPWFAFVSNFPGFNPFLLISLLLMGIAVCAMLTAGELWAAGHSHAAAFWLLRLTLPLLLLPLALQAVTLTMFLRVGAMGMAADITGIIVTVLTAVVLLSAWLTWILLGISTCLLSSEQEDFLPRLRLAAWLLPPVLLGGAWLWSTFTASSVLRGSGLVTLMLLGVIGVASSGFALLAERPPSGRGAKRGLASLPRWLTPLRGAFGPGGFGKVLLLYFGVACLACFPLFDDSPHRSSIHSHDPGEIEVRAMFLLAGAAILLFDCALARIIRRNRPGRHRGMSALVVHLCLGVVLGMLVPAILFSFRDDDAIRVVAWILILLGSIGAGFAAACAYREDFRFRPATRPPRPPAPPAPATDPA